MHFKTVRHETTGDEAHERSPAASTLFQGTPIVVPKTRQSQDERGVLRILGDDHDVLKHQSYTIIE